MRLAPVNGGFGAIFSILAFSSEDSQIVTQLLDGKSFAADPISTPNVF